MDSTHCKFYLVGWWIFLYSYKYNWALFCDAKKLPENKLILSALLKDLLGGSGAVLILELIILPRCSAKVSVLCRWCTNHEVFCLTGGNRGCLWSCLSGGHCFLSPFPWSQLAASLAYTHRYSDESLSPQGSVLGALAPGVSRDSQFHLFSSQNAGVHLGFPHCPDLQAPQRQS